MASRPPGAAKPEQRLRGRAVGPEHVGQLMAQTHPHLRQTRGDDHAHQQLLGDRRVQRAVAIALADKFTLPRFRIQENRLEAMDDEALLTAVDDNAPYLDIAEMTPQPQARAGGERREHTVALQGDPDLLLPVLPQCAERGETAWISSKACGCNHARLRACASKSAAV